MEYRKFSQEQLDKAKNADLIAFLSAYMGLEFKRAGKYFQCKQHSSLVVYADRKGFVWNSQNISGGDTIDFLRKVEGKSFPEAIETIIGESAAVTYTPAPKYKAEAGQLELPEKAEGKYNRVYAYLSQTRGISPDVISDFMKSKQLYQDTRGNCVFVGFDEQGAAKFGCVRGTLTERKYRGDCKNSDKRYAFIIHYPRYVLFYRCFELYNVTAHSFCHQKVNVFCQWQTAYFVKAHKQIDIPRRRCQSQI